MSTTPSSTDKEFWQLADSFIALANEHCNSVSNKKVSAAFLYAAARFNAFIVAANSSGKEQLAVEKDNAVTYFMEEYERMLRENLDDHIENFERYSSRN